MNKIERASLRFELAEDLGVPRYTIIFKEDRLRQGFHSQGLYRSFARLPEDDQKRIQVGSQFVNHFDGHSPVLVGDLALAHWSDESREISSYAVFVMNRFERFVRNRSYGLSASKVSIDRLGSGAVFIRDYGCLLLSAEQEQLDELRFQSELHRFCGYNLLIASPYHSQLTLSRLPRIQVDGVPEQ